MTSGIHPAFPVSIPKLKLIAGFTTPAIQDLDRCAHKKCYSCGLVECTATSSCEYSINCGEAGLFCKHPSVKYTEKMLQALMDFR